MLPSNFPRRSVNSLAIELFAGPAIPGGTSGLKTECMRWPLDPREAPMDETCIKTLDDFYMCSSGLVRHCTYSPSNMNVSQEVNQPLARTYALANSSRTFQPEASPLDRYGLPKPGRLRTYDAFVPRRTRSSPPKTIPRKSRRAALYKDYHRIRNQTQLFASRLLGLSKNVPSLVVNYFTPKQQNTGEP